MIVLVTSAVIVDVGVLMLILLLFVVVMLALLMLNILVGLMFVLMYRLCDTSD